VGESAGQEVIDGKVAGIFASPMLTKNGTILISDPQKKERLDRISTTAGLQQLTVDLICTRFEIKSDKTDYFGNRFPQVETYDVGNNETVNWI